MNQWGGYSKTASRARSRRRGGDSDARPGEAVVTPSSVSSASIRGLTCAPITVDLEDDDVIESSPRAFAQAFKARAETHRSARPSREPVDEDLVMRFGPRGTSESILQAQTCFTPLPRAGRRGRPARSTIDLTTPSRPSQVNDDCVVLHEHSKNTKKRKPVAAEPFFIKEVARAPPVPEADVYKLSCAICMDTMKNETSTICGHIFCRGCIEDAINSQKKCPTCRKKLTMKNIHRIYL